MDFRAWLKGTQFKEKVNAKNLVAVVTGANAGIGKQIARELNLRGAKVYMLCRDKDRGHTGMEELAKVCFLYFFVRCEINKQKLHPRFSICVKCKCLNRRFFTYFHQI
jgi:hypothetical protein